MVLRVRIRAKVSGVASGQADFRQDADGLETGKADRSKVAASWFINCVMQYSKRSKTHGAGTLIAFDAVSLVQER